MKIPNAATILVIWLFGALFAASVWIAAICVIIHFVRKFW